MSTLGNRDDKTGTVSLADEEAVREILVNTVFSLWDILIGKMWTGLVEWAGEHLLSSQSPLANAEDISIPHCVDTADEAIAIVNEYHSKWLRETHRCPSTR